MISRIRDRGPKYAIIAGGAVLLITLLVAGLLQSILSASTVPLPARLKLSQADNMACNTLNCWVGIVPGITTIEEAQRLLEAQYGKDNLVVKNNDISWLSEDHVNGLVIFSRQGQALVIDIGLPEGQLTVSQLIAQIQEPSFVYVNIFSADCEGGIITFPELGIHAEISPIGIQSTQSISRLSLLTLEDAKNWDITDSVKLRWHGFVDYCAEAAK